MQELEIAIRERRGCGVRRVGFKIMEGLLKRHLSLKEVKVLGGAASGGCINNGQSYDTDRGKIFVKYNEKSEVSKAVMAARLVLELSACKRQR